jgi:hypothetical protein
MIKEIYEIVEECRKEKEKLNRAYSEAVKICEQIEARGGIVIGENRDGFLMYEVKRLDGPRKMTPEGVAIIEKREGVFGWLPTLLEKADPVNPELLEPLRLLDSEIFRIRNPRISFLKNQALNLFGQWFEGEIGGSK